MNCTAASCATGSRPCASAAAWASRRSSRGSDMETIRYDLRDGIATLTFDEPGSAVNTMCERWQADLSAATQQVVDDKDAIRGILLASAKATTFFAGADLK